MRVDIVFLAVGDHAIAPLAAAIAASRDKSSQGESSRDLRQSRDTVNPRLYSTPIFVHSSGSVSMDALDVLGKNVGVFYPMQIFRKGVLTMFEDVPVFLEGNEGVMEVLQPLAARMSGRVSELGSEERLGLHLGAVIVCNFTNHLYRTAQEIIQGNSKLDFSIYEPLIREHIEKVFTLSPNNTQTGPAIRDDKITIQKHLDLLKDQSEIQGLYRDISRLINPECIKK